MYFVCFSYINYSNIAARLLRRSLRKELRVEAEKRGESHIRFTPWANGKPVRKYYLGMQYFLEGIRN